ncbi:MAG: hypothetical protein RR664_04760 [Clostridia bacterium]
MKHIKVNHLDTEKYIIRMKIFSYVLKEKKEKRKKEKRKKKKRKKKKKKNKKRKEEEIYEI